MYDTFSYYLDIHRLFYIYLRFIRIHVECCFDTIRFFFAQANLIEQNKCEFYSENAHSILQLHTFFFFMARFSDGFIYSLANTQMTHICCCCCHFSSTYFIMTKKNGQNIYVCVNAPNISKIKEKRKLKSKQ